MNATSIFRIAAAVRGAAASRADLRRALIEADRCLRDGSSIAWAVMQARRVLAGRNPVSRPLGGAA